MSKLVIQVRTPNGVYEVWKPRGRVAPKHLAILLKYYKFTKVYKDSGMSDDEIVADDNIMELYEQWVNEVLPYIIKTSPFDKEKKKNQDKVEFYKEVIPFEDQWLLFIEVLSSAEFPDVESFR